MALLLSRMCTVFALVTAHSQDISESTLSEEMNWIKGCF